MKISRKKSNHNIKKVIILIALSIIVLSAIAVYSLNNTSDRSDDIGFADSSDDKLRETNDVDYSTPEEEDVNESQDAKMRILDNKNQEIPKDNNSGKQHTPVAIASYGVADSNFEVRAFAPNIIEDSGICYLSISSSEKEETAESKSFPDVSTTICRPLTVPESKLPPGEYSIKINYSSPNYTGEAEVSNFTIN